MSRILHLAPAEPWQRAVRSGEYRGSTLGADLDAVGFVHASTASQLPRVIERIYRDVPLDDHVLLVIDIAACERAGSPVRWEVPDGAGEAFPHVYGPVPVAAVVAVAAVRRDGNGVVLPSLAGLSVLEAPPDTI